MKNELKYFLEYRVEPKFNLPPFPRRTPVSDMAEADAKVREKTGTTNEYLKFSDFLLRSVASQKIVKVYPKNKRQLQKVGLPPKVKGKSI